MVRLDRRDEGGFFVSIVEALGPARQAERLLGRKQARLVEAENTIRVDAIENIFGEMRRARQRDPPVGFRDLGANNSMFSRALCLSDGAPFEESLNEIGGEDSLLLERLTMRGLRFAWAARAGVVEWAPPRRLDWAYVCKRKFLSGQIRVFVQDMAEPGRGWRIAFWMVAGLMQFVVAGARASVPPVRPRAPSAPRPRPTAVSAKCCGRRVSARRSTGRASSPDVGE